MASKYTYIYFFDQLAVSSECSTQFEGTHTVEVQGVVQLSDELRLRVIVEAESEVTLVDDLAWVMLFDDAIGISSTAECQQTAYKQSVVELLESLEMWGELPLQESEIELTDELVLDIIGLFLEGVVELTDELVLTIPDMETLESVVELSDELVLTDEGRLPLGWRKVTPHIPTWTKISVN